VSRRQVRVTAAFFDQLDKQFGTERGPDGEPSVTDFIVIDLPAIIERFAEGFDELPEAVVGVGGVRTLVAPGVLVDIFVVYGMLADDGVVDLLAVTFEP
jgi:hypothetical protein